MYLSPHVLNPLKCCFKSETTDDEVNEPKYLNWMYGAKGLEYLHEGLRSFVGDKVLCHRDQTLQNITSSLPQGSATTCSLCTEQNLLPEHASKTNKTPCIRNTRKSFQQHYSNCFGSKPSGRRNCPNNICSTFYDKIVDAHRFNDPLWKNTDPSTWCSDPMGWSYAKCFQTTPNQGTCSLETDAAGLLSIIINDSGFQTDVACNLTSKNNIFVTARESRNAILHCAKLELEDLQLRDNLDTFIAVLQDPKYLLQDQGANEAVQKLVKLKDKQITISRREEVRLIQYRKDALIALEQLKEKEKTVTGKIEETTREALEKIHEAKEEVLERIDTCDTLHRIKRTEEILEQLKAQHIKRPENPAGGTEIYRRKSFFKDLKLDLIKFYRQQHSTVQLSPLIKQEDVRLLDFYVKPDIKSVEIKGALGGGKEKSTKIKTLSDVFSRDGKNKEPYNEIYMTADAGYGKTCFSKRLALAWCHANDRCKKDEKCFSKDEIDTMSQFGIVFLVLLRDCNMECEIADLIWNQLILQISRTKYSQSHLERFLTDERCLVILDGLDEWTHPKHNCKRKDKSIPHRDLNSKSAVLTTTRPWKLSDSCINASQIDKRFEIDGLSSESQEKLKRSVISHADSEKDESQVEQDVKKFDSEMKAQKVLALAVIPILLMYMLCLFCDKISLGKTQVGLYCKIIEMLLKRTVKKYKKIDTGLPQIPAYTHGDIPPCFSETKTCRKYYSLLKALGQLAYDTLLPETKEESMLVFDCSVAKRYLQKEWIEFCLKAGIITQSTDRKQLSQQPKIMSFPHKTIQEFLAALYMSVAPDPEKVQEAVLLKCKCISDILQMSKVIVFIGGFNAEMSFLISGELMKCINEDEYTLKHRRSVKVYSRYIVKLIEYQNLCISCLKEMCETKGSMCLQDVSIDTMCIEEQYRENLQYLITRNKHIIRSIYIDTLNLSAYSSFKSVRKVIDYFSLSSLANLEKIHITRVDNGKDIFPLLNASIKCVFLSFDRKHHSSLNERVKSLDELKVIAVRFLKMSHTELSEFYDYIEQRHCLKRILLVQLDCNDHGRDCLRKELDLSRHSKLRELAMDIRMREICVNLTSLEKCRIGEYPIKRELVMKLVGKVTSDSKLTNTCLEFRHMKMSVTTFRYLVDLMRNLQRTVILRLWGQFTIEPKKEFENLKKEIRKSSQQFNVLQDDEYAFTFETFKGGM